VGQLVFSPDGERLVAAGSDPRAPRCGWCRPASWSGSHPRHASAITSATFSPDGRRVITCTDSSGARVWDAATGQPLTPPLRHGGALASTAFSADGGQVATVGHSAYGACGHCRALTARVTGGCRRTPGRTPSCRRSPRVLASSRIDEKQERQHSTGTACATPGRSCHLLVKMVRLWGDPRIGKMSNSQKT